MRLTGAMTETENIRRRTPKVPELEESAGYEKVADIRGVFLCAEDSADFLGYFTVLVPRENN